MFLHPCEGVVVQMTVMFLNLIRPVADLHIIGIQLDTTCPKRLDFFPFLYEKFAFFHPSNPTDLYKAI